MNELWAEADSIVFKALDGKSSYIIDHKTRSAGGDTFIRGKEFFFYTAANHTDDDPSPLYHILEAHKTAWNTATIPPSYNQTTYDNVAAAASLYFVDSENKMVLSGEEEALGLEFSLKAHTRDVDGEPHYLWDKGQPNPERHWRYAICEILIGDSTAGKFEFSNDFDKYNCFKIHNISPNYVEFYFGTESSHNYSVSLEPWGQICVRRDSVTEGYDSTYRYFFKCNEGDPRFLHFKSHAGFVPDSMRANNITNASFIYNIIEVVGERGLESVSNRITFDPHKYNDITEEYSAYIPTISNSTLVGDLIFHKGYLSYFRAISNSSTPETGIIQFDGFDNFETNLALADLAGSTGDESIHKQVKIWTAPNHEVFYLWQKSTNLLTWNDSPRVLNLGSSGGSTSVLETDVYPPIAWESVYSNPEPTNGIGTDIFGSINAAVTSVGEYIALFQAALTNYGTTSGENIKLTTEGPILFASEHWEFSKNIQTVDLFVTFGDSYSGTYTFPTGSYETGESYFNGFNTNNYFDLTLYHDPSSGNRVHLDFKTDRSIAYRLDGDESRSGWPSSRFKHHRMFEGPKHSKKYQNRGDYYIHLDIENDPFGPNGEDFKLKDIGTIDQSDVAFQTVAVETKIEPMNLDITSKRAPSYPLTLPGDVSHELEGAKNDSSISEFQTAMLGNDKLYIRLNLLKEHFNDMVTLLDRVTSMRPVCFDEVYFGDLAPVPSVKGVFGIGPAIMPKDAYAAFEENSAEHALYQRLEIPIKGRESFPNDIYTRSSDGDRLALDKYKWVTIKDVKQRANELGFKFRYEKQFFRLDVEVVYNIDVFSQSESGNWKSPITKPVLTSQAYIDEKTTPTLGHYAFDDDGNIIGSLFNKKTVYINDVGGEAGTRLETVNFDSNLSVLIYLYDDTRTLLQVGSVDRAKFALKQIGPGSDGTPDTLVGLDWDEQTIASSDTLSSLRGLTPLFDEMKIVTDQAVYFCQVSPPVTHSITPVAVPSSSEENTNQQAGLHQIIFR